MHTQLIKYLDATLGIRVVILPWTDKTKLPLFLQERYSFYYAEAFNQKCLFVFDTLVKAESPAVIRKHIDQLDRRWNGPVIYVCDQIVAYNRKRLVEHKVAFIVPNNQMYLPPLGIDLREYFKRTPKKTKKLKPATQALLVYTLLSEAHFSSPTFMAKRLGYSVMAMSRAFDELETAGLIETVANGRERQLKMVCSKYDIWNKAQLLLRTPVVHSHAIHVASGKNIQGPKSGLDALACYSMLAEPANKTIALKRKDWQNLKKTDGIEAAIHNEPGSITVEVWSYAPLLFAYNGCVDRLSLYLSLRENKDERVQAALELMLKEVSW